jgi:surface polysaccharide O-acyltransferase-like enzyme
MDLALEASQGPRQVWLDWLRAAATFAIIALHVTTREKVRLKDGISDLDWWSISCIELITRLAVPLFFMISGVLIIEKCVHDPWNYIIPKVRKVFLVLILWMICYSVWEWLKKNVENPFSFILKLFAGVPYFHLWFLVALMTCYLTAPILMLCYQKWPNYTARCIWVLPILVGVDFFISFNNSSENYFRSSFLEIGIPYIPLFLSGFLATKSQSRSTIVLLVIAVLGLLCALTFFAVLKHSNDPSYEKYVLPLSPPIAIASIATFKYVFSIRNQIPRPPRWVMRLSRDSAGIYLLHPIPLDTLNHLKFYGREPNLLMGIPFLAIFVLMASWLLVMGFRISNLDRYLFP